MDDMMKENADAVFDALQKQSVATALVTYYGGGDSGDVEEAEFTRDESDEATSLIPLGKGDWPSGTALMVRRQWTREGWQRNSTPLELSIQEAVSDLAMQLVNQYYGGWENNEGGEGTVTLTVSNRSISINHGQHVQTTEWHTHEVSFNDAEE